MQSVAESLADGRQRREERRCNNQPDKRHGRQWRNKRQQRDERQRCWQIGDGSMRRGDATTSRTRGARGNGMERGMTRGNGAKRGRVAIRWEVAV